MRRKIIAITAMAIMLGMTNMPNEKVFANGQTEAATDSAESEKGKDNENDRKAKMEAAIKKWDALSADQKAEVYKIFEERQTADAKMLDKLASLGIMEKEDVTRMKTEMKKHLTDLKASGKLPLRRFHKGPKPSGVPYNKDITKQQ